MDRRTFALILGSMLFALLPAHADTLTLRNNAELNGQVQYENDSFTISARFRTGSRTLTYGRKEVRSVELNSRDFNPGAPPAEVSILDAQATGTKDAAGGATPGSSAQSGSNKKNGPNMGKFPLSSDDFESATQDTVCLRDQTKLMGRVMRIQKGSLVIKIGRTTRKVDVLQVTTVLVAPG